MIAHDLVDSSSLLLDLLLSLAFFTLLCFCACSTWNRGREISSTSKLDKLLAVTKVWSSFNVRSSTASVCRTFYPAQFSITLCWSFSVFHFCTVQAHHVMNWPHGVHGPSAGVWCSSIESEISATLLAK